VLCVFLFSTAGMLVYIYLNVCMSVFVCVCMCVCAFTCVCVCGCVYGGGVGGRCTHVSDASEVDLVKKEEILYIPTV